MPNVNGWADPNNDPVVPVVAAEEPKPLPVALLPKENVLAGVDVEGAALALKEKSTFDEVTTSVTSEDFPKEKLDAVLVVNGLATLWFVSTVVFSFSISARCFL